MTERIIDGDSYLRVMFDAMPSAVLVVDHQFRLLDTNRAADELLDSSTDHILGQLSGNVLQCLNAVRAEKGCGTSSKCAECVVRGSVRAAERGEMAKRQMVSMLIEQHGRVRDVSFLITAAPFGYEEKKLALLVLEDVTELAELRRLLPMCSYCRKVRDDGDFWQDVEQYLSKYTGVDFSHGVCPDCMREHFPDLAEEVLALAKEHKDDESDES
jgi:PAS domain-containing protein